MRRAKCSWLQASRSSRGFSGVFFILGSFVVSGGSGAYEAGPGRPSV